MVLIAIYVGIWFLASSMRPRYPRIALGIALFNLVVTIGVIAMQVYIITSDLRVVVRQRHET